MCGASWEPTGTHVAQVLISSCISTFLGPALDAAWN